MRKSIITAVTATVLATGALIPAVVSAQEIEPIRVTMELGSASDNLHRFHPDHTTFKSGTLYTLVVTNPTSNVHEIDSEGLVGAVLSVETVVFDDVGDDAQKIAMVVGAPKEIVFYPGSRAEWTFWAVEPGDYELVCFTEEKDGTTHWDAGMKGTFTIE